MDYSRTLELRLSAHTIEISADPKNSTVTFRLVSYQNDRVVLDTEAAQPDDLEGIICALQELLHEVA